MRLNKRATAAARKRQASGIKRLREAFAVTPAKLAAAGLQHGNAEPVRLRPGVPTIRDAEHAAKHRRRKAVRASRKRNRA